MPLEGSVSILEHFADLPDPRVERTRRHELLDILVIAICAILSSADSWEDVEEYGKSKREWLQSFLQLPNGIPSHDTFNRVFARLDPQAFQEGLVSWLRAVSQVAGLKMIAIDGKTLRHSFDRTSAQSALHLVSAWATENHLTLGQVAVDDKSNEITAIPKLLKTLDVSGAIVTIDAMGCQTKIAAQIREGGGDYVLAVKENQPHLCEDVQACFETCFAKDREGADYTCWQSIDQNHGRTEIRNVLVLTNPQGIRDQARWQDLQALCMVSTERTVGSETGEDVRYYIGSLKGTAEQYGHAIRGHWGIENSLHWVLDVSFGEDRSRLRSGHGPENLAMLRRLAVSLLKNEKSSKRSVHGKRLKSGWDDDYLLQVLGGFPEE